MKKLALAICLLVVSIAAQAQFDIVKTIRRSLVLVRKPVHSLPTVSH